MKGARYVGRGLADTYENLVHFTLLTLIWWICVISIVLAPSATIALFMHADPRIGTISDRPSLSETVQFILRNVWRGWRLALLTVPVVLLLLYNIGYYGTSTSATGILAPLWMFLFVIALMITISAFSIEALREETSAFSAGKLATIIVGAHLFHAVLMVILTVVIGLIFAVLIIPLILFFPATVAAIFNRFILAGLRISIPNPLAPTPERTAEGKEKRKWWGP